MSLLQELHRDTEDMVAENGYTRQQIDEFLHLSGMQLNEVLYNRIGFANFEHYVKTGFAVPVVIVTEKCCDTEYIQSKEAETSNRFIHFAIDGTFAAQVIELKSYDELSANFEWLQEHDDMFDFDSLEEWVAFLQDIGQMYQPIDEE